MYETFFLKYNVKKIYIAPCDQKICKHYSNCITKQDNSASCFCPTCFTEISYNPVCADDGMSYANLCWMKRQSCITQQSINVLKATVCGKAFIERKYYFIVCN